MLFGFQTEEFLSRLEAYKDELPSKIVAMAELMKTMIREIEIPSGHDINHLHNAICGLISEERILIDICGEEGDLCDICPFGAYLPQGVSKASSTLPLCIPWISLHQCGGGEKESGGNKDQEQIPGDVHPKGRFSEGKKTKPSPGGPGL